MSFTQLIKNCNRKFATLSLLCLLVLCSSHFISNEQEEPNEQVYHYYIKQIDIIRESLQQSHQAAARKLPQQNLQDCFLQSRIAYKKLSPLSEFLNKYETKNLNAPALPRIEEDKPKEIIPPHGYQVLEEIIYSNKLPVHAYKQVGEETKFMIAAL